MSRSYKQKSPNFFKISEKNKKKIFTATSDGLNPIFTGYYSALTRRTAEAEPGWRRQSVSDGGKSKNQERIRLFRFEKRGKAGFPEKFREILTFFDFFQKNRGTPT
ncbi:MAG: hypothetical protein Q4A17_06520 [Thermoguttaceae bacterium]|nr:hypothetical protein [Thermoguttaceae bacterium]